MKSYKHLWARTLTHVIVVVCFSIWDYITYCSKIGWSCPYYVIVCIVHQFSCFMNHKFEGLTHEPYQLSSIVSFLLKFHNDSLSSALRHRGSEGQLITFARTTWSASRFFFFPLEYWTNWTCPAYWYAVLG